jgi:hypothetical protein
VPWPGRPLHAHCRLVGYDWRSRLFCVSWGFNSASGRYSRLSPGKRLNLDGTGDAEIEYRFSAWFCRIAKDEAADPLLPKGLG